MKFLKGQNLSKYSPADNALAINPYGRAVMDINGGLLIPKGTTAQRPYITADVRHGAAGEVDTSKIANGYMRFNTDTEEFEGYINGRWETIRAPGASAVSIETFGDSDGTETIFGPLANVPAHQNNLLVFVENVFQIAGENFEMVQNPSSTDTGEEVLTTNFIATTEYIITNVGDTDFTAIGASANTVGTVFTATGAGGGTTGRARPTGYYLEFYTSVPFSKFVTVLFGFAN